MLVAAMVTLPGVALGAQERPGRAGIGPAAVDRAAARALRLGDEIELTDAQRQQLRDLRTDALAALERWERESLEVRQELRARRRQVVGDPETTQEELRGLRDEARTRMAELRSRQRELTAPIQERYEAIVGAEQRLQLRETVRRDRGRAARGRAMRDRWDRVEGRPRRGPSARRGGGPDGRPGGGIGPRSPAPRG
jgi:hypothetical protein